MKGKTQFELEEILPMIPHRPPFLFVDRVTAFEPGKSIVAERLLRAEESYFEGHFPGKPLMPGVLIAEALAQASGLLVGISERAAADAATSHPPRFHLASTNVKFLNPAEPGDVLVLRSMADREFAGLLLFSVEALVGAKRVASGVIALARVTPGQSA